MVLEIYRRRDIQMICFRV